MGELVSADIFTIVSRGNSSKIFKHFKEKISALPIPQRNQDPADDPVARNCRVGGWLNRKQASDGTLAAFSRKVSATNAFVAFSLFFVSLCVSAPCFSQSALITFFSSHHHV
jgi:hypothetical protein